MSVESKIDKLLEQTAEINVHVTYLREKNIEQDKRQSKSEKDIEDLKKWKWRGIGILTGIGITFKYVWHKIEELI